MADMAPVDRADEAWEHIAGVRGADKVMPLVDLAIIHGGQGSVQTAIASGIPIIGFPLQPEQEFNLRMMENHGAGICMPLKKLKRSTLQALIEKVLKENSFKTNIQRLKSFQGRYNGADNTAAALLGLISDS